jgi:hypothetical protein
MGRISERGHLEAQQGKTMEIQCRDGLRIVKRVKLLQWEPRGLKGEMSAAMEEVAPASSQQLEDK